MYVMPLPNMPQHIDPDELHRIVGVLQARYEPEEVWITSERGDGTVLVLLDVGPVFRVHPSGLTERHSMTLLTPAARECDNVTYRAFYDSEFGTVGYLCLSEGDDPGPLTFLYFNPSDTSNNIDVPNVFVYNGPYGEPGIDPPEETHFLVWPDEVVEFDDE